MRVPLLVGLALLLSSSGLASAGPGPAVPGGERVDQFLDGTNIENLPRACQGSDGQISVETDGGCANGDTVKVPSRNELMAFLCIDEIRGIDPTTRCLFGTPPNDNGCGMYAEALRWIPLDCPR